jgi:hypothetical protein
LSHGGFAHAFVAAQLALYFFEVVRSQVGHKSTFVQACIGLRFRLSILRRAWSLCVVARAWCSVPETSSQAHSKAGVFWFRYGVAEVVPFPKSGVHKLSGGEQNGAEARHHTSSFSSACRVVPCSKACAKQSISAFFSQQLARRKATEFDRKKRMEVQGLPAVRCTETPVTARGGEG